MWEPTALSWTMTGLTSLSFSLAILCMMTRPANRQNSFPPCFEITHFANSFPCFFCCLTRHVSFSGESTSKCSELLQIVGFLVGASRGALVTLCESSHDTFFNGSMAAACRVQDPCADPRHVERMHHPSRRGCLPLPGSVCAGTFWASLADTTSWSSRCFHT